MLRRYIWRNTVCVRFSARVSLSNPVSVRYRSTLKIPSLILRQFVQFSGVGIVGTACHYAVLAGLVQVGGADPVVASALGFCVGALVNYFLSYHVVFRSNASHRNGMPKFFTIALTGLILNTAIMNALVNDAHVSYLLSQVIATGCVLFWNFFGNRLWTFRVS
jgi:putative flippase GtrA